REGSKVKAFVDAERRAAIRRAHSATHILHYALHKNLGSHAQQQGSKVDEDWLRFDFTNLSAVTGEQLSSINVDVAERVAKAEPVRWDTLPLAEARKAGAMMLFGEKYPDPVRMVSMGSFSKELCGGTHLTNTREVEQFEILSEEGVSAGTRRITALTGKKAAEHKRQVSNALQKTAEQFECIEAAVPMLVENLQRSIRVLRRELAGGPAEQLHGAYDDSDLPQKLTYEQQLATLKEAAHLLSITPLEVPTRVKALHDEMASLQKRIGERRAAGPLSGERLLESAEKID